MSNIQNQQRRGGAQAVFIGNRQCPWQMLTVLLPLLLAGVGGCKLPTWKTSTEEMASCRELSQQGLAAIQREDWQAAERSFSRAIKACPVDPDARRYYSEALWSRGDQQGALAQLHEAIRISPADPSLRLRLAELALEQGDYPTASAEVSEALDLDPTLSAAWVFHGKLMSHSGRLEQAVNDFHRALKYEPQHFEALFQLAEVHRAMNQPRRALNSLQELTELYPPGEEPQEILFLTGLALLALGQHDEAVSSLQTASERGPPSAEVYCRLAEAQLLSGRPDIADHSVRLALRIMPEHPRSLELLERIAVARDTSPAMRR